MAVETVEIVNARTGEALEEEMKKNALVLRKQEEWRSAVKRFEDMVSMTHEQSIALQQAKDTFIEYNAYYREAVYRMGYSDGILVGMEQQSDGRKSVLAVDDMANLISVYEVVRQLKKVLLGRMDAHWEDAGAFSVFEHIFDIIDNATCSKIKLLGEDESVEMVTDILNNETEGAAEKAKQLLGME